MVTVSETYKLEQTNKRLQQYNNELQRQVNALHKDIKANLVMIENLQDEREGAEPYDDI